ncbi:hypothetical protein NY08_525 [Rhodococcus sp. B7740]|uniref:hypothetical protein n=1 Tax=Rhodococcus sp. B7740 TaxID=1564114 RepID=UPI0005D9AE3D|nr:hypothetical protein [Rhodococcus sp. B7740]AJW38557.1 hypothetical protein NY08_525 [Rhodococcus sp. B7740]
MHASYLPMHESPSARYVRQMQTWMNPGLDFSQEKAAEKERIARLFGKALPPVQAQH